jgi:CRISPR-associated endoribonuclease Cas6
MRFRLVTTPSTEPVPFSHLPALVRTVHRWLGHNNAAHDGLSLYSVGWLLGGRRVGDGLTFSRGAVWEIGFHDPTLSERLVAGVVCEPELFSGMVVETASLVEPPAFSAAHRFEATSPIVARTRRADGSRNYLPWSDPAADAVLTGSLHTRLRAAGLESHVPAARAEFCRTDPRATTKLADFEGVRHKGSMCAVMVHGGPEVARLAWLAGVGSLTGSGFGALR